MQESCRSLASAQVLQESCRSRARVVQESCIYNYSSLEGVKVKSSVVRIPWKTIGYHWPVAPIGHHRPVAPIGPVRVTRGALIAHLYTFAPPRCRTSQYRRTFNSLSVSLWNDLVDPVFDGVGLAGFKSRSNAFLLT